MKYDLKTWRFYYEAGNIKDWFEGFEAQERKKNVDAEKKWEGKTVGDMSTHYWWGYIQRGKEILGE
jgi:hypothetical protein